MSAALAGTGLDDLRNLTTSLTEEKWVVAGLHSALVGVEGAGMVSDPFGTLASWGVGWIIEHLQPIKGWYDKLGGEPERIRARAKDMYASAAAVTALADDTADATRHSLGPLAGLAVASGSTRGHDIANTLVELGTTTHSMGKGLEKAATLVEGVRGLLRDIITEIVMWVGKKLLGGVATALTVVPDLVDLVGRKVPRARRLFDMLSKAMSGLSTMLDKVRSVLEPMVAVAKRAVSHVPTVPPATRAALKKPFWQSAPAEAVTSMVASANDDAHDRPPAPKATRVPHSATQAPGRIP